MTGYGYEVPAGFKLEVLALIRGTINTAPVIPASAHVLEAGAGFGTVTDVLSRLGRHVTAVEALPESLEQNRIHLAFAANVRHVQAALVADNFPGDSVEILRFPNPMMSSTSGRAGSSPAEKLTVPVIRPSDVPDADALVLDIEGAEVDVLLGSDLSRFHTIVLEWHPHVVGQHAVDTGRRALNTANLRQVASTPSWGNGARFEVYRR